jgi:hypothetical protein
MDISSFGRLPASGLISGAEKLAGTPGDIERLYGWGAKKLLGTDPSTWSGTAANAINKGIELFGHPSSQQIQNAANYVGIPGYEPKNTPERYVNGAAEFVPAALAGPIGEGGVAASVARNALQYGVVPGLLSEAAGEAANKATAQYPQIQPWAEGAARLAGAVAGPGALTRLVSPNAAQLSTEAGQLALRQKKILNDAGVEVTPGDVLHDQARRSTESELSPDIAKRQQNEFTRAAAAPLDGYRHGHDRQGWQP